MSLLWRYKTFHNNVKVKILDNLLDLYVYRDIFIVFGVADILLLKK